MKILVIDRENLTNQLILSKLSAKGYDVTMEVNKNSAIDMISTNEYDCVMLDPAPLSEARPIIHAIWKNIKTETKPYMLLLTKNEDMNTDDAIMAGCNDFVVKPLDLADLEDKIQSAERFMDICRFMAEENNTVKDAKGLINKSAFNQLFLSALDRSFRYGERSLIIFIHIANYDNIKKVTPAEGMESFDSKIAEKMNLMRRQSDVIGRLSDRDYAILLQRPQYESEPIDAANRFSEVLEKFHYDFAVRDAAPKFELDLVEIPQGILHSRKEAPSLQEGQEIMQG